MPTNVTDFEGWKERLTTKEIAKFRQEANDRYCNYMKLDSEKRDRADDRDFKKEDITCGVNIDGSPAWQYISMGHRLRRLQMWFCTIDEPFAHTPWFTPELFERMCIMDEELKEACRAVVDVNDKKGLKKVEEILNKVLTQKLLSIIIQKFQEVKGDLAKYFAAKAHIGLCWEEDEVDFKALMHHLGYNDKIVLETKDVKYKLSDGT